MTFPCISSEMLGRYKAEIALIGGERWLDSVADRHMDMPGAYCAWKFRKSEQWVSVTHKKDMRPEVLESAAYIMATAVCGDNYNFYKKAMETT